MRILLLILFLSAFTSSCAIPTNYNRSRMYYVGKFYPPSLRVDVVFDERDLKTNRIEFMGEIAWTSYLVQKEDYALLEKELMEEALQRGADAMIVSVIPINDSSYVRHTLRIRLVKYLR